MHHCAQRSTFQANSCQFQFELRYFSNFFKSSSRKLFNFSGTQQQSSEFSIRQYYATYQLTDASSVEQYKKSTFVSFGENVQSKKSGTKSS
jgi:hypothetical protein